MTKNRLIYAEKVAHVMCKTCSMAFPDARCNLKHCAVVEMIRKIPTVDAVEVVHGEWEYRETRYGYRFICSECGMPWMMDASTHMCKKTDYCPNCGAKMDKKSL